ncbi:hypothetical protein [Streptomyces cadmiisoli]|uniref:hypothetical protein n=1 Tax=Streptomyces cadmiisoli TaxID=2184053 RepID=UPI00365F61F9
MKDAKSAPNPLEKAPMAKIRRVAKQTGGLLVAFAFMGISACAGNGGPSKRELKKIATSAVVQTKREKAEKDIRDRVREITTDVTWLNPLSVVIYDQCADVRGNAHLFDPNPPRKASMICGISSHIIFSTDRSPKDVVVDVRRTRVTDWTESSISDVLAYYGDDNGLEYPDQYVPLLTTDSEAKIHESLRWDTEKKNVSMNFSNDALWDRSHYQYSKKSVDQLRQEHGVMYMWSIHANAYHTVP